MSNSTAPPVISSIQSFSKAKQLRESLPPDPVAILRSHNSPITALHWTDSYLFSADFEGVIHIWNPKTRKICLKFQAHKSHVSAEGGTDPSQAKFQSILVIDTFTIGSKSFLFSHGRDGFIRFWSLDSILSAIHENQHRNSKSISLAENLSTLPDSYTFPLNPYWSFAVLTSSFCPASIKLFPCSSDILPSPTNPFASSSRKVLLAAPYSFTSSDVGVWDLAKCFESCTSTDSSITDNHPDFVIDPSPQYDGITDLKTGFTTNLSLFSFPDFPSIPFCLTCHEDGVARIWDLRKHSLRFSKLSNPHTNTKQNLNQTTQPQSSKPVSGLSMALKNSTPLLPLEPENTLPYHSLVIPLFATSNPVEFRKQTLQSKTPWKHPYPTIISAAIGVINQTCSLVTGDLAGRCIFYNVAAGFEELVNKFNFPFPLEIKLFSPIILPQVSRYYQGCGLHKIEPIRTERIENDPSLASWIIDQKVIKTISNLCLRQDSRLLISSGWDAIIRCYDFEKSTPLAVLPNRQAHNKAINALTFDPASKFFASGANDGRICIWNVYSK